MIALLSDQLESEVTIESLEGRVFPRVSVSGRGVVIRHKGRTDVPPLISIDEFEIRGSLRDLMQHPRRVGEVRLRGLQVKIPPGDDTDDPAKPEKSEAQKQDDIRSLQRVIIEKFEAPDTVITLIPKRAGKPPKVFTVHHLVMDSLGVNQTIPYIATLTNPVPKGEIETSGTFGPWNVAHPARTPVTGKYTFANANLDTIQGLAGVLSSTGEFHGPLNRIEVQGTTDTPKFQIDAGGSPVPLKTRFTAIVDGSDGDTYLTTGGCVVSRHVDDRTRRSHRTRGRAGTPDRSRRQHGETVASKICCGSRSKSEKPILLGAARLQAKLVIPPEKKKVIDKLQLNGEFVLSQATFTDAGVQTKLVGLSRRGRGMNQGEEVGEVLSNLRGRFVVENAAANFSSLTFSVPGAAVELAGRYGLRDETINFKGKLKMQATLSQVAGGGVKGFFLKAFDPFFREKDAGTVLPIKIEGNRKKPTFGLDMF